MISTAIFSSSSRDLLAAERGEPGKAELQDRPGLRVGEPVGAVLGEPVARIVDERDERTPPPPPASRAPSIPRGRRRRPSSSRMIADHLVDMGDGDGEADQGVRPLPRLVEEELGPPADHLLAEGDEGLAGSP